MTNPRVTALIDTYNHGRYLEEAIESVLAQDFPAGEMEILVVDDGSTDDTPERVTRFGSRVRHLRKENGGQASALNLGFARARGEIVAMLDGDDLWLPNKLRRVMHEFDEHPEAGMVYHPYRWWNMEASVQVDDPDFPAISGFVPDRPADLLRYGDVGTCGMALRKAIVQKLFPIPPSLRIYADTYLVYLVIFITPVVALNEPLTIYRHHGRNLASFQAQDAERLRQRWSCYQQAITVSAAWLERAGWDLRQRDVAAYVKRHELVEQMLRFTFSPPSRGEFFSYLRAHNRLYASLWTPRYRLFRAAGALAGLLLGYRMFESLRTTYGRANALLRLREAVMPARSTGELAADRPWMEGRVAAR